MEYDLNRFVEAQAYDYEIAKKELLHEEKRSHWIWYIFPQIKGLGMSYYSEYYGLDGVEEAKAYYEDKLLGARLLECTNIIINAKKENIDDIMSAHIDSLKLRSSMTLFYKATGVESFKQVIDKYFNGEFDEITLDLIGD